MERQRLACARSTPRETEDNVSECEKAEGENALLTEIEEIIPSSIDGIRLIRNIGRTDSNGIIDLSIRF
jgi:hypothetical protein